jgi:hypothetical protein
LVEIHVVGAEQPQRLVQQLGRTVPGPVFYLCVS